MRYLYPLLSCALTLFLLPAVPLLLCRKKYRQRIARRLGFGLTGQLARLGPHHPTALTFWIHALSVGEATSALPLVREIRRTFPAARIFCSITTASGNRIAEHLLAPHADLLLPAPIDLGPVVPFFIRAIKPDLFILVETDFWPHWLSCLARKKIPLVLVNGRISKKSWRRYQRCPFLFRSIFKTFTLLSMQTTADAEKMVGLGIEADKVITLGNLKFDSDLQRDSSDMGTSTISTKASRGFVPTAPLWICGSTHDGEEKHIFAIYKRLQSVVPELQLLIAPRNIERSKDILALGAACCVECRAWTTGDRQEGPVLILDTIGDLAACYPMAEVVFIGGTLVAEGGHNPLEAAGAGVPVLFGPHMEDFEEIAEELTRSGGALQVDSPESLHSAMQHILYDPILRTSMAAAALQCVNDNRGVARRHLASITGLLFRTRDNG
jgi:3-deoxy-D-manno-octulosonic-acid transferase